MVAPVVSGLLGMLVRGKRPTLPRLAGSISVAGVLLLQPETGFEPGALLVWFGETLASSSLFGLAAIAAGGLVTLLPFRGRRPVRLS